jgi:hypothetical protein
MQLVSTDRLFAMQIAAVRGLFRHVVERDHRVLVGVPPTWIGHELEDVREVIDGVTYADVTSALAWLATSADAEDPLDMTAVEDMLEFELETHADWYRAALAAFSIASVHRTSCPQGNRTE